MAKWCMGIDLGGTFIKFGLLDADSCLRESFQVPTPNDRGAAADLSSVSSRSPAFTRTATNCTLPVCAAGGGPWSTRRS